MSALSLSPDVYGRFARFSAVADFLELVVLKRPRLTITEPDLERRLETDGIRLETPLTTTPAGSTQAASIVFDILLERARVLEGRYPFEVTKRNGLKARTHLIGTYRVLLALTTAHAYRIHRLADPKKLFEGLVERTLKRLGLRTATTGTSRPRRRSGGGFPAVLAAACAEVGLESTVDDVIISHAAQDMKVDTLAHLDLRDRRSGRWTFIGQVTIAESGEWEKKAAEPKPKLWQKLIADTHSPAPFLAIPHHVEPRHLESLHGESEAIVLDRLRIALRGAPPTSRERALVTSVDDCRVEW